MRKLTMPLTLAVVIVAGSASEIRAQGDVPGLYSQLQSINALATMGTEIAFAPWPDSRLPQYQKAWQPTPSAWSPAPSWGQPTLALEGNYMTWPGMTSTVAYGFDLADNSRQFARMMVTPEEFSQAERARVMARMQGYAQAGQALNATRFGMELSNREAAARRGREIHAERLLEERTKQDARDLYRFKEFKYQPVFDPYHEYLGPR